MPPGGGIISSPQLRVILAGRAVADVQEVLNLAAPLDRRIVVVVANATNAAICRIATCLPQP